MMFMEMWIASLSFWWEDPHALQCEQIWFINNKIVLSVAGVGSPNAFFPLCFVYLFFEFAKICIFCVYLFLLGKFSEKFRHFLGRLTFGK